MGYEKWLAAASAAAYLTIALLAAARRARHPLAVQLGLLSVGLFAYNLQEVLSVFAGRRFWMWFGAAAAALVAIAAFELFLGFLGAAARFRAMRRLTRVYFVLLALVGLAPLVDDAFAAVYDSGVWALLMLLGLVPCFGVVGVLTVRHARRSLGKERQRARMLGATLLLGFGSVMTDLADMAGLGVPRLSYVGLFLAALVVAALTFESKIIEGVTALAIVNTAVVALMAVAAQVALLSWAGTRTTLAVFGTLVVGLASIASLVPTIGSISEQRGRTRYLLTLGRFAQQMAHDVRNPLAAIKGSAQFLKEERAQGRSMDDHEEMLDIVIERVDRIERFIRDYQRMGRVEPMTVKTDVRALVGEALRLAANLDASITVDAHCPDAALEVEVDPDLLGFALENVVRNACDAMPEGGHLVAEVAFDESEGHRVVRITVRDTGMGMNPRTLARVLRGFYTTKDGGSGLGLVFVRRVTDAHGGKLFVESEEGQGTSIGIELPIRGRLDGA